MIEEIDSKIKKDYLKKQPVFALLNDEEAEVLATLLTEKHFKPGDTIVSQGDHVDSVYLIVSGEAEVRLISIKDHEEKIKKLGVLGPDAAIGLNEAGFYSLSGIRSATVVALTDMVTLRLSVAAFHGFALMYAHVNETMRKQAKDMMGF